MASLLGKRISAPTRTTSASGTKVRFTWSITACRAIAGAGTAPASGRYTTASLTGAPPGARPAPSRTAAAPAEPGEARNAAEPNRTEPRRTHRRNGEGGRAGAIGGGGGRRGIAGARPRGALGAGR